MEGLQKVRQMRRAFEKLLRERPKLPQLAPAIFIPSIEWIDAVDIVSFSRSDLEPARWPFEQFFIVFQHEDHMRVAHFSSASASTAVYALPGDSRSLPLARIGMPELQFDLSPQFQNWVDVHGDEQAVVKVQFTFFASIVVLNEMKNPSGATAPMERQSIARTIKSRSGKTRTEMSEFITIRPSTASASRGDGTGTSPCAHERRGHYRQYRSGKRIWIKQTSIKGGSIVPRNFRLGAQG